MQKLLIFLSFLTFTLPLWAVPPRPQPKAATPHKEITKVERPDMDAIRREVTDPGSKYFYPNLMARYERHDTVMNLDEYRHLYYGRLFQEDFNPYRHSQASTRGQELYFKANHTRAELDSIITYAQTALDDTPFDLQQMNFLIYALQHRGKVYKAKLWQYRLNHLLQAIVSSGTGADPENAWYVINPQHEYNIINFLGAVAKKQHYQEPYFDCIEVEKADAKGSQVQSQTYYFNIRNLLEEYYRKFPDQ